MGRDVGRFIPKAAAVSYLTDSLTGILKEEYDLNEARAESMRAKYGSIDWHQYCSGCTAESIRVCKRLCNDLETVWDRTGEMYVMRKQLTPEQIEDKDMDNYDIFLTTERNHYYDAGLAFYVDPLT